jgi:hypothetical protein
VGVRDGNKTWWRQCTTRANYLESCLPSCHSVCPAAKRSREQVFYWLLRKHLSSIPLLLMISLSLLTVNNFIKPACAGVSHCWRVSPHAILWASGRRIGAEQMFPTGLVQKPSSIPTLLPACLSFGYQDNLPEQYWDHFYLNHGWCHSNSVPVAACLWSELKTFTTYLQLLITVLQLDDNIWFSTTVRIKSTLLATVH